MAPSQFDWGLIRLLLIVNQIYKTTSMLRPLILFTLFILPLFSWGQGAECAANAGADQSICPEDEIQLNAPFSADYNTPLDVSWSYVSGPENAMQFNFSSTTVLNPTVTHSSNDWPAGDYVFQICVECADLNMDGTNDVPCDFVTITVNDPPPTPVITENDGNEDGEAFGCYSLELEVTPPGDLVYAWEIIPNDGRFTVLLDELTGEVSIERDMDQSQDPCDYVFVYQFENGGCVREATVNLHFQETIFTDGTVVGRIDACPSCSLSAELKGDDPGCTGNGAWTVISGPNISGVVISNENLSQGDADVTVPEPGLYTFEYSVTGNTPCEATTFTVSCEFLDIGDLGIGNGSDVSICSDIIEEGTIFSYMVPDLPNTFYEWTLNSNSFPLIITNPHGPGTDLVVTSDIVGEGITIDLDVEAFRLYIDEDCDGPLESTPLIPPFTDPTDNWNFFQETLSNLNMTGGCYTLCEDNAEFRIQTKPRLDPIADDVYFLCTDGSETVRLRDLYSGSNGSIKAFTLHQPPGDVLDDMVSPFAFLDLPIGDYTFEIQLTTSDGNCTSSVVFDVFVRSEEQVNAGTDQVKCVNEPTRLNGNTPYDVGVQGTWTQINCNPCIAEFVDANDPNTQILLPGIDQVTLPTDLEFQWTFNSQDDCDLSDVTTVTIQDCVFPCDNFVVDVVVECAEETITLTANTSTGFFIDPNVYDLDWKISGVPYTGNPIVIPNVMTFEEYVVEGSFVDGMGNSCNFSAEGIFNCGPPELECDVAVIETCDENGNVTVSVVDEDGNLVPPTTFLHMFTWRVIDDVNGGSTILSDVNPITISPANCYSLRYERWYFSPGVPQLPGLWDSICVKDMETVCPDIQCACSDFPSFLIIGYEDDKYYTYNPTFPEGSSGICEGINNFGTLGIFNLDGTPIDTDLYNIAWSDGSTDPFVTGYLTLIGEVEITSKDEEDKCFWDGDYTVSCVCEDAPWGVDCEQEIWRVCYGESVTYYYQDLVIDWIGVAGATSYTLEFTFDNCCVPTDNSGIIYETTTAASWTIPDGWDCFTVRVRANGDFENCAESEWSQPYTYCAEKNECDIRYVVCGCCKDKEEGLSGIQTRSMTVEEQLQVEQGNFDQTRPMTPAFIESSTSLGMLVYPNPFTQDFTIELDANPLEEGYQLEVIDLYGRVIQTTILIDRKTVLSSVQLSNGVYFIKLYDTQGQLLETDRVVKQ